MRDSVIIIQIIYVISLIFFQSNYFSTKPILKGPLDENPV